MEKESLSPLESLGLHSSFDSIIGEEERGKITEEYISTANDPDQIPINKESLGKLKTLSQYVLNCAYDGDKPVSWTVAIPTSLELMNAFLHQEITEHEMFDRASVGENEALYICSAFTVPEYRGKGIAKTLLTEQILAFMDQNQNMEVFTWVWSDGGGKLIQSLPEEIARKVKVKK